MTCTLNIVLIVIIIFILILILCSRNKETFWNNQVRRFTEAGNGTPDRAWARVYKPPHYCFYDGP